MSQRRLATDIGQLLRTTRELRGVSQGRLAERVGISQQRLSMLERGTVDPRLGDMERLFEGLRMRLRVEAEPVTALAAAEDPDLLLRADSAERRASVFGYVRLLDKFHDVPYVVGGRLAAMAHGMPVRVLRLDLFIAEEHRSRLGRAIRRFSTERWSERWQEFRDYTPAERPGPLRWRISGLWELRITLVSDLPERVAVTVADREVRVPPLPWLEATDPDVADLRARLTAAGWPARTTESQASTKT
jgi:transcriptional regulator with XRE-family HTH domain